MITLFGATGYTGRLVAQALDRAGLEYRIAGRSPERLEQVSRTLPSAPAWVAADATRPETLPALFQGTKVLVNCAGPFTDLGEPVVAQAALSGVHYLDTTNELGFVRRMHSYDQIARESGAAVVPACGFEVALADCAAAALAGDVERAWDEVRVIYLLSGQGSSYGTRLSAVRSLATSWVGYRQGRWVREVPGRRVRRTSLESGGRVRPVLSFPSSEIATVPTHVDTASVTTWMVIGRYSFLWAPAAIPAFSWLARGPVGSLVRKLIVRVAPPPDEGLRSEDYFRIRVELRGGDEVRAMVLSGRGVYDLTARIIAHAAGVLTQPGYDGAGVLAPAQALDPNDLLQRAETEWGISLARE